ncbi:Rieske domain-containing protein isoform X2 [Syngnathoides biaculeatus]|nr:Rieske domain-containing protein isoform X2 [Syngnathoides biaculeatus]XP_061689242.1 Rieske domain-containing protein isoform X2 [Syngnathoides biaculeatus]XP_061689243.1 Rieske domain-containing protein isoform X2 [Syngnathoides biaculeatus]XP_061689244.1 Rieske domain-containing protein isoform X2 [Syngnathoides biaculeatus]XP_061689245.1 Rieske domain-containing protein isoform X2 [Syngnathoides biaculeatus]
MEQKEPPEGHHFVGKKDALIKAKRTFKTLGDRDVLLIYHQGRFYALDYYCYHAGSKLETGDIEEIGGKLCIICPKHKYKISLAEGEGLCKSIDKTQKKTAPIWYSKGVKQRVHTVTENNGDVYVELSHMPRWVESDYFQGEEGKEKRAKAEATAEANDGMDSS